MREYGVDSDELHRITLLAGFIIPSSTDLLI
jgi:hypothetical protein